MLTLNGSSRIEYLAHSINGMAIKAREFDYSVNIIIDENLSVDELAKQVLTRRTDGLIFLEVKWNDERFLKLHEKHIPMVQLSNISSDNLIPIVEKCPENGINELIQYIMTREVNTIGFLDGGDEYSNSINCREYFYKAMKNANLELTKVVKGDSSFSSGENAAKQFIEGTLPDIIFCTNDLIALGLVRELQKMGLIYQMKLEYVDMITYLCLIL